MLLKTFFGGFALTLLALAFAFFMTPELTRPCTEKAFSCLEKALPLPFFQRIPRGIKCVFANAVCVAERVF